MDIFKHFRKCFLCGQGGSGLEKVSYKVYHSSHTYSTVWLTYHPFCLKLVLCEPERYNRKKVNKALQIICLIKDQKKEKEKIKTETEKERRECIKKAKEFCKDF